MSEALPVGTLVRNPAPGRDARTDRPRGSGHVLATGENAKAIAVRVAAETPHAAAAHDRGRRVRLSR